MVEDEDAPRWRSLDVALRSLVHHEREGRNIGSTLGRALTRAQLGLSRTVRAEDGSTRQSRRADDVLLVSRALERAFDGGREGLTAEACQHVLLDRTPGGRELVAEYEQLAEKHGVAKEALYRVVKHGRAFVNGRSGTARPAPST